MSDTFTLEISLEDFLKAIADPKTAIIFAVDHLEPWETATFLREWKEGKDMTGWLHEVRERQITLGD
ncbi:hypothetical protein [Brucella intermedia]|uniref:hypothetical protein n=1 Tax=Brucella intermedia TaxID=94625 RepID=UPI00224B6B99|nr:hypothetical protein [Brucella intermedia]